MASIVFLIVEEIVEMDALESLDAGEAEEWRELLMKDTQRQELERNHESNSLLSEFYRRTGPDE
jgi:hypothetical protein